MRRRWLSRRAWLLHVELMLFVPGCLFAGWWQVTRALRGNGLSWFYSIEWPIFAVFAVFGWWHLLHEDPEVYTARKQRRTDWDQLEVSPDQIHVTDHPAQQ